MPEAPGAIPEPQELDRELLARLPFARGLSAAVDAGKPLLAGQSGAGCVVGPEFEWLAARVGGWTPPQQSPGSPPEGPAKEGSW